MVRKMSKSEARLPPPQPSPESGEGGTNAYPLPQHGGGLGRGKRHPGLSAPTHKIRTRTKTLKRARQLRTQLTDAELLLWKHLRRRQMQGHYFRKQCPIGPYIADFACLDAKLIIELDGGQHSGCATDQARDLWLSQNGFRTLRFWNNELLQNIDGALTAIIEALNAQAH